MNQFAKRFSFFFVLLYSSVLFGFTRNNAIGLINAQSFITQEYVINGKIVDGKTGEPIPYCNIVTELSSTGTASNELGEFVIKTETLPTKIIFSHINYEKIVVDVSQASNITVSLKPLQNILEEVTVSGAKNDKYALELAKKAYKNATRQLNKQKYGRAFYRQKAKNGNSYSEFSEIVYDIRYSSSKIEDWDILEGRYAIKNSGVNNKNYTLLSRLLTPLQPNTNELIFPLHPQLENFYDVKIIDYIGTKDDKIAVIWFKPKENTPAPTFEAEIYINTKTFSILKITGNLSRDDLKLVKLTENNSSWKDYGIAYEIAYREDSLHQSTIDYIKIDQEFDYFRNDSLKFHTSSTSNLTFIEHYVPTSRKKLGRQFRRNKSDWQKLDKIGYNEKFWNENPFVKRTPVEKEVISSFEKDKAFGIVFLNSKDQVALMQSDIAGDPFIKQLGKSVNNYNNYNPVEKVYLHTDKGLFSSGETLWYSGYVTLGPFNYFSTGSKVLHIGLISPKNEIVVSQTQEIVEGKAIGSIEIPEGLPSGNYQLRSYTNWMRNFDTDFFFTKTIKIGNERLAPALSSSAERKIDLQFFPEGGQAVAGLNSLVAFKAIDNTGSERKIQGRIIDSQGNSIANLNTIANGAGFFAFKPTKGQSYSAILEDGSKYSFPKIINDGYVLNVNNANPKSIQVKIQATALLKKTHFYIVGLVNNKKYYQGKFEFKGRSTINFEIPKNKIPNGVMTLTLFDSNNRPWCERIVFVNNQEELVITTRANKKRFKQRERVELNIHVTDTDGRPVSADLSISATDTDQVSKDERSGNILTHLLMQSDIKGHISAPGLLFKNQKRSTLYHIDLIMLTHGWRKISWQKIQEGSNKNKEFPFSKGLPISGLIRSPSNKLLPNVALDVIATSEEQIKMFSTKTSHKGRFLVSNFNFAGTTEIAFNAYDNEKTPLELKITLDSNRIKGPKPEFKSSLFKPTEETDKYISFSSTRNKMDTLSHFKNATKLEEVIVTEKKIEKPRAASPPTLGHVPDDVIFAEDNKSAHTVLNLVTMLSGVTANGNTVSIRNQGSPLWILDGKVIHDENPTNQTRVKQAQARGSSGEHRSNRDKKKKQTQAESSIVLDVNEALKGAPAPRFVANMDAFTVERIELLKGPRAAIYGSRSANGVILIYTKRGEGKTIAPIKSEVFSVPGHSVSREFYSPKYDVKLEEHDIPDYRATLYWNPSFTTDRNGNAKLSFFNSDNAKQIQIAIEGLSIYGTPGTFLDTFGKAE